MHNNSGEAPMYPAEGREAEGVARPNLDVPERADGLARVQAAGGDADEVPGTHSHGTASDEFQSLRGGQLFGVHDGTSIVEGFGPPTWIPVNYQVRGVEWLSERPGSALFLKPGSGKTSVVLASALRVQDIWKKRARMLVIAPLTVAVTTWMAEPKKWKQFSGLKVGLARGPERESILQDVTLDVVVTNYDALEWAAPILMQGHNFDILCADEITRLKHIQSKRFKRLKPLLPTFKYRWGLTGTPAANGLLDLFGQIMVLDYGQRLGRFITHFRMTYFYQKPWDQYRFYISDQMATKLIEKISDICMYLDNDEEMELPPLIDVLRQAPFNQAVKKQYDELEEEFILRLETGLVTAANAGVLTSKLRQFTGGGIYSSSADRSWSEVHRTKIELLDDLVEELAGEPLMVAYQFEHEFERLTKEYPKALYIKGGMSKKQLQETVEQWNTGDHPLMLVQPSAAALGLNLQFGGSNVAWYTLTYNLEEYIQLIARLLRKGQTKTVMNYILAVEKTIDAVVAKVLVEKNITQDKVFEALQGLKV
jgi:SNF2 family DNA or RNA helicase